MSDYDLNTHTTDGPLHPCCGARVGWAHLAGCGLVAAERSGKTEPDSNLSGDDDR